MKVILSDIVVGIIAFLMIVGVVPLTGAWVGLCLFLLTIEVTYKGSP